MNVNQDVWPKGPGVVYGYACDLKAPCIYFIRDGEGHIKIGMTEDIKKRMRALAYSTGKELTLYAKIDTPSRFKAAQLEKELHEQFKESNYQGEWFYEKPVIEYLMAVKAAGEEES